MLFLKILSYRSRLFDVLQMIVFEIVHMLIAIVIFYIICWSPTIIDELLIGFGVICGTSITQTLKLAICIIAAWCLTNFLVCKESETWFGSLQNV